MDLSYQHRANDVVRTLGLFDVNHKRKRIMRWGIIAIFGVLSVGVGLGVTKWVPEGTSQGFKTGLVHRGGLTVTITAMGTLRPVNQVDVGSEVSGTIATVKVDYNDRVRQGQLLAMLNTDEFKAEVLKAEATLESKRAKLKEARATVIETKLKFARMQELAARKLVSQEELDEARAAYLRAQAGEASAKAEISVAQATLNADQTKLAKTAIQSPIDGIVLARKVEPGQTVAASFQTPVLFTLAKDVTRMELYAQIDESDVGQIKEGQDASFTADAFPKREFPARITSIRNDPQTVNGLVTYETLLSVDNSELLLRPGMTATIKIKTYTVPDAILVPNSALRFTPPWWEDATAPNGGLSNDHEQRVWVLREGQPVTIPVSTGTSDGQYTEILDGDLNPGQPVLINVVME